MRASAVMALRPGAGRRGRVASRPPWRSAPMARRRRLAGRAALLTAAGALVATALMVQLVALANGVVTLRRRLEGLQAEQTYQEARLVRLQAAWNEATSCARVTERAERELNLVASDQPARVVVLRDERTGDRTGLRRLVGELGAVVPAVNAQERRP